MAGAIHWRRGGVADIRVGIKAAGRWAMSGQKCRDGVRGEYHCEFCEADEYARGLSDGRKEKPAIQVGENQVVCVGCRCGSLLDITASIEAAEKSGAGKERAAIVAWLKTKFTFGHAPKGPRLASWIEEGHHLKGGK